MNLTQNGNIIQENSSTPSKYINRLLGKYELPQLRVGFQNTIDNTDANVRWRKLYTIFATEQNQGKIVGRIPPTTIGEHGFFAEYAIRPMNVEMLARAFGGIVFKVLDQVPESTPDIVTQKRYEAFKNAYVQRGGIKAYVPLLEEIRMQPEGSRPSLIMIRYKERIRKNGDGKIPKGLFKNAESLVQDCLSAVDGIIRI